MFGEWHMSIFANRPIGKGELISLHTDDIPSRPIYSTFLAITFDGGSRAKNGRRVAGAGAILWSPCDHEGNREFISSISVAIPFEADNMFAEGFGLRCAIALYLRSRQRHKRACVMGDNAPVLKHVVGERRLHRVDLASILEVTLAVLATAGGCPRWVAVRRSFNKAADQLATRT